MRPFLWLLVFGVLLFASCSTQNSPSPVSPVSGPPTPTPVCNSFTVFGHNTIGGSSFQLGGYMAGTKFQLTQPAMVYSLSIYLQLGFTQIRLAIYNDNAGQPGSLMVASGPQQDQSGWNTIPIPGTYLNPGNYWIIYLDDASDTAAEYASAGISGTGVDIAVAGTTFPATFPSASATFNNANWSLYASYCPVVLATTTFTPTGTLPTFTPTSTWTPTSTQTNSSTPTPTPTPTWTHTPGCANTILADITANIDGASVTGNLTGKPILYDGCTGYGSGPDDLYTFTLSSPATITVSNCPYYKTWFTTLRLFKGTCGCSDEIGGSGPNCGYNNYNSQFTQVLTAGTYYLAMEGFTPADHGAYTFDIFSKIATNTPTITGTPTWTYTPTWTPTKTQTSTPTITATAIFTPGGHACAVTWGGNGTGTGQFNQPYGMAVVPGGNVYVSDLYNNRVQAFDTSGTFLFTWGTGGTGDGQFTDPGGMAIDGSGNVYVTDIYNYRVQVFNAAGTFLSKFGSNGYGNGQFSYPNALVIDGSGNIYVSDNNRIEKFNNTPSYVTSWTLQGSSSVPHGLAIDSNGYLLVGNSGTNVVEVYDTSGNYITSFGTQAFGIAVDGGGNIYLSDYTNNRILEYNSSYQLLTVFGSTGTACGQFDCPAYIGLDAFGNLYTANYCSSIISKTGP